MSYRLVLRVPLGKGTGRFYTIDGNINPSHAIDIALDNVQNCQELIIHARQNYPRPFRMMPKYLLFTIMKGGQPNIEKPRQIGQFQIPLNGEEPRIVKEWR